MKKQQFNKFLIFSGLGIQMGLIIYLSAWVGGEIDEYYKTNDNTYKTISVFVGFLLSFISLVNQLKRINKDEENDSK